MAPVTRSQSPLSPPPPPGQSPHLEAPRCALNRPDGQSKQPSLSFSLYFPAGQSLHALPPLRLFEVFPPGQNSHLMARAFSANFPSSQAAQGIPSFFPKCPGGQALQVSWAADKK